MRIVLYTNILTPYRKYFFDTFYMICKKRNIDFIVLVMAESEPNRNWSYKEYMTEYTQLLVNKTFSYKNIFIHYNPTLKKKIKELKPSIIICAGSYLCPGIYKILKMKEKFNYKTYFWSESHLNEVRDYSSIKIKLRDLLRKKIYTKFDGFWYAGKLSLEFIEKYAKIGSKNIFVPNLVDDKIFDYHNFNSYQKLKVINKYKLEIDNKLIFICPARLTSVKGIDKFFDMIKNYDKKDMLEFLLIGNGELESEIKDFAQKNNINAKILGYLNQYEVAELYSVANVFLMPSLSDPNPLTCIEALWEGLPLVVSNHVGNYPEVVLKKVNGFVFDYNLHEKNYKIFDFLLESSDEWFKNAKDTSYEIARKKYATSDVVNGIIDRLIEH